MPTAGAIICADALAGLGTLPDESVQCVVTSPPYYGLRDYGIDSQIGLESSPAAYLAKLVAVFREVRRVLRKDGVAWVNMGDSYNAGTSAKRKAPKTVIDVGGWADAEIDGGARVNFAGLKPKDLCGMPWRLAFALQADGWWLRQDIIWAKPNPMPESVTDRCTKAHEYVFLLTKSERYFYDADAISEPSEYPRGPGNIGPYRVEGERIGDNANLGGSVHKIGPRETRNKRSVWTITTEPYPDAHFATFPTELPRICILAGSRQGDTILDPFNGSGTTGQVALELGREYVGIELNPAYVALTHKRLSRVTPGLPFAA